LTRQVIYRSHRSWHTNCNFRVFTASDFLAAAIEHIPPKGQQTIRYYGLYSNKRRGLDAKAHRPRPQCPPPPPRSTNVGLPHDPAQNHRFVHKLWRELIRMTWGADPLECPCCHATMKNQGKMQRREEIEFFLRLHGLWEGVISLPPPPDPPYDVETLEPLEVPPVWIWAGETELPPAIWWECGGPAKPKPRHPELDLGDGRKLVLDGDPGPEDNLPVYHAN
jgi:hypothetical protein